MPAGEGWRGRRASLMNQVYARAAGRARIRTELAARAEPHLIGSVDRGRQLASGKFMFAGYLVEAPDSSIWDLPQPAPDFTAELHGFGWLDDLAALGDQRARALARDWTQGWTARFGRGRGPGWTPTLTGRRLLRLIDHSGLVLDGVEADEIVRSWARQARFLSRRWHAARPGLPRFEALTGLLQGGLSLRGLERYVDPAHGGLSREAGVEIDRRGGIATRNPEELAEIFTLLTWSSDVLLASRRSPGTALLGAVERVAPALRALRHSDGALARFHGGGRGMEGRLDSALFQSGVRSRLPDELPVMGYSRLHHARTSVVVDTAPPPKRQASHSAHASTLAFELTSGRRPLIVNCGSGTSFGASWSRAGRATASHSTLGIDGYSSSRLRPGSLGSGRSVELLTGGPKSVPLERRATGLGTELTAAHDGYVSSHGVVHVRRLELAFDGRSLNGEDSLVAGEPAHRRRFDRARTASSGIAFAVRFHVHPNVEVAPEASGRAIRLLLTNGEAWVFRPTAGRPTMRIDDSVYLEPGRLTPLASRQVILFCLAVEYSTRIGWSLAKSEDTPAVIRDVDPDETY